MMPKMITKTLVAIALAVLIAGTSFAQQDFLSGQTPPSVDWRQIQSARFTIIFPEEITNDAQRLANTLEHTYGPVSKTLRGPQKPLEVVLTNQTTVSNGFVGLAPRRSLWSTTPDQNVGNLPGEWLQLLALHEMRHVVQQDRMRRGFIRLWWALSGELGESLVGGLLEPKWSSEGDAVGDRDGAERERARAHAPVRSGHSCPASGGTALFLPQSLPPIVSRLVSRSLHAGVFYDDLRQAPLRSGDVGQGDGQFRQPGVPSFRFQQCAQETHRCQHLPNLRADDGRVDRAMAGAAKKPAHNAVAGARRAEPVGRMD